MKSHSCRIFAYGSLMWRPGFSYVSSRPAKLHGYHRRLSVFSNHYRGTDEKPGLVLGLDRGGSCIGVVYDVAAGDWDVTISKVRERELLNGVYTEVTKNFTELKTSARLEAITYVVNHGHKQFAPEMELDELLHYINQGSGIFGTSRDYIANTLRHLRELGIHDTKLEKLAPYVMHSGSHLPEG